jgi:hypothetical protein
VWFKINYDSRFDRVKVRQFAISCCDFYVDWSGNNEHQLCIDQGAQHLNQRYGYCMVNCSLCGFRAMLRKLWCLQVSKG